MQLFSRLAVLLLAAGIPAGAAFSLDDLPYDLPTQLLEELGVLSPAPSPASAASSSNPSSATSASSNSTPGAAAACVYPATFTLNNFTTWSPASNASLSYVSFFYTDNGTQIATPCANNASSTSLTAGTGLAPRYACDNSVISFIWQKGEITLIEATCPGQTTTKFEASGTIQPTGLECKSANCTSGTGSGHDDGTLCKAAGPLTANFTSQEPSPLQH